MLPYAFIAPVLLIALAIRFIVIADAAPRSKWLLGVFTAASVLIWWIATPWRTITTLVQIAVSVYVIIYQVATSESGPSEPL